MANNWVLGFGLSSEDASRSSACIKVEKLLLRDNVPFSNVCLSGRFGHKMANEMGKNKYIRIISWILYLSLRCVQCSLVPMKSIGISSN